MALSSTFAGEFEGPLTTLATDLGLSPVADWEIADLSSSPATETAPAQRWHDCFVLAAPSLAQARAWLPLLSEMGKAHSVVLLLKHSGLGFPAAQQTAGQLAGQHAEEGVPAPDGYSAVRISAGKWVDVHASVAAALLRHRVGRRVLPLGGARIGLATPYLAPWACGDGQARVMTLGLLQPEDTDIYPVDFILADEPLEISGVRQPAGVLDVTLGGHDTTGWSVSLPPVDTAVISPAGFLPYPELQCAVAEPLSGGGITVRSAQTGEILAAQHPGSVVGENLISKLRNHNYLDVSRIGIGTDGQPFEAAALMSAFAVAGIPLLHGDTVAGSDLLGAELLAMIARFDIADDPITRESKSINMRRVALEYFSPSARWGHWASAHGRPLQKPKLVSVVLATRRPERIRAAIAQIARQSWPRVEIVLALHGIDIPERELSALAECGRPITVLRIPTDRVLGEVLNAGVDAAEGQLIAKMDDDDWYGENHLLDLVRAMEYSGAHLVGSQVEFLYLEDLDVVTRRPPEGERFANHVAGGTMLISTADLLELGGWRPVHRAVDRCLIQAVNASGGSIYRGHGQNYVMHRHSESLRHGGHTWVPDNEVFLQNSAEQWNGFVLPPQIDPVGADYRPVGRAPGFRSIFSDGHNRTRLQGKAAL